jgi:predicted Rossmann fold flavoprotein
MNVHDVVVIGAGPAGMLGAARAAERGLRVLLLEKNTKPGVKILMSGGTRCNLTHATDARGIVAAFGRQGNFLHSALARLGPSDLVALVEAEGVPTKREVTGKIFPASDRALDIQQAFVRRVRRSGAVLRLGCPVKSIRVVTEGAIDSARFELTTGDEVIRSVNILVTTGGLSYPGCGTTGDGYPWAESFGHTLVPRVPALTPITVAEPWVRELSGLTLADVRVSAVPANEGTGSKRRRSEVDSWRGSFLFTHKGLSGPAPMNVSRAITLAASPGDQRIVCDFAPDVSAEDILRAFEEAARENGRRGAASVLQTWLPHRLAEAVLRNAGIEPARRLAELPLSDRRILTDHIRGTVLVPTGTLGYDKAEVTAGGVSLREVDSRTMESRIVPGLYFAGEVLDLDGPIGGFNFQAAFSTGWLAGESMEGVVSS